MSNITDVDEYWSPLYDKGREFTSLTPETISKLLSFTDDSQTKTCLDIGCGTGQLTRELFHRGYQCVGVDASTSAVSIAQSLTTVPEERLQYIRFDIEHGSLKKLPHQPYSVITCKFVYAFIKDKPLFLKRVKQLLAPKGICIIISSHVDDVPAERRTIAINDQEIGLLSTYFAPVSLYKGDEQGGALTYFVGT